MIPEAFFSDEAEQAVLGGLLLDNNAWTTVRSVLTADSFYRHDHREIFRAIESLAQSGDRFDVITVSDKAGSDSMVYIGEMARNTPSATNIEKYARIVEERYQRRQVASAGLLAENAAANATTPADAIAQTRAALDAIGTGTRGDTQTVEQSMADWIDLMHERKARGGKLQGLNTGFDTLNARWFGLCQPDLIILAGRPSMGKTTLGMNIAEAAAAEGASVLVFSLEMATSQLIDRRVSSIAGIPLARIRECDLDSEQWEKIPDASNLIAKRKLAINDTAAISIDRLLMTAASHQSRYGLDLVVVDYLTLVTCPGAESRLQEVRSISAGLKRLAKYLQIPVLALAQLNRKSEDRANKRPMMADLRESGDIEQDADIVAFVHRQERYEPENEQWHGIAEVITEKHRNGEIGTDLLNSELHMARFTNRIDQSKPAQSRKFSGRNGREDL